MAEVLKVEGLIRLKFGKIVERIKKPHKGVRRDRRSDAMGLHETGKKTLNAKFFVRILPSLEFSTDSIKIEANCKAIHVRCLQKASILKKQEKETFWCFAADEIFCNRSQEDVYKSICKDLVEKAMEGVSGMILAYGQTGSGKTFTVSGLRHHYENRGLILRLLSSLCEMREVNRDLKRISISISYAEFMASTVKDLLRDTLVGKFKELKKSEVEDEMNTWKLIFDAETRKSHNEGAPYAGSHRGHTVCTFHVLTVSLIESYPLPTYSKIHVVDMAGIDSLGNSPSTWKSRTDLGYSNLSKALMEQLILCITGKTWKITGCICPYKSTKLLDYLQDALQPSSMIRFIGHILGNKENLPMTLSVLRFGAMVRGFKPAKLERQFRGNDPLITLKVLEVEVARLRAELDLIEIMSDSPNHSNVSKDKLEQVRRAAKNFLLGNIEKLTLLSLGQAEITLDVFKETYDIMSREKEDAIKEAVVAAIEEVQSQLAPERLHPATLVSTSHMKPSRRRSRQHDWQSSLAVPPRSSETGVLSGAYRQPSASSQVGNLDKKGIGVGMGKSLPSSEGIVTRALKKVRSRKSDTADRPAARSMKDAGVLCSKDFQAVDSPMNLPEKIPSKEEAWQEFCTVKSDLVQVYRDEILKLEENVRVSRRNYTVALCELGKFRDALDKMRKEWDEWKHIQQIYNHNGEDDGEGTSRDESTARFYADNIEKKEVELNNAVEHCHVTLIDFRSSKEELAEARAALETEFQVFCSDSYKTAVIPEERSLTIENLKGSAESTKELDSADQMRMDTYFRLQHRMMSNVSI